MSDELEGRDEKLQKLLQDPYWANVLRKAWEAAALTDEQLVGIAPGHIQEQQEMTRRLIVSNREVRDALRDFRESSEKAANRLNRWTAVLVLLTIALVVLTGVLLSREFV